MSSPHTDTTMYYTNDHGNGPRRFRRGEKRRQARADRRARQVAYAAQPRLLPPGQWFGVTICEHTIDAALSAIRQAGGDFIWMEEAPDAVHLVCNVDLCEGPPCGVDHEEAAMCHLESISRVLKGPDPARYPWQASPGFLALAPS